MTSKLTVEEMQATDSELQMLIDSHEKGTAMFLRVDAYYLMAKELQERRTAEMDSEPVAWKIHTPETGVTYVETNSQSVENIRNGFGIKVEITPLYRHA